MKGLQKASISVMALVLAMSLISNAYARSASVVTHASIVILPRSDQVAPGELEILDGFEKNENRMVTRMDKIDTPQGEKFIYTMVGVL